MQNYMYSQIEKFCGDGLVIWKNVSFDGVTEFSKTYVTLIVEEYLIEYSDLTNLHE
jgi:hypothetical protein